MSHSQFHSTNLFILRHAWLNLWDKHMTTGRINQVTTFLESARYSVSQSQPFSAGVHSLIQQDFSYKVSVALSPGSHIVQTHHLLSLETERSGLQRELPAISKWSHSLDHGGFSSALVAEKVWPSASSPHFPPTLCASTQNRCTWLFCPFTIRLHKKSPFQISILLWRKSTIDLAQDKPANPSLF